jgi:hypothetical protein
MLIVIKTSIKTILILLLLIAGTSNMQASGLFFFKSEAGYSSKHFFEYANDTIKVETNTGEIANQAELSIPDKLKTKTIDFQINSDISYLNINHFVKNDSKKLFIQAWQKENEVKKLYAQTDSLRKMYANSSEDRRQEISSTILQAEQQTIALNEEIPVLYEKARNEENQYWQAASPEMLIQVQRKIQNYKDSVRQTKETRFEKKALKKEIPDTIIFVQAKPKEMGKDDVPTGIIYKIQVGAYKNKMPESAAKAIKKLSLLRKVENYKDEKGVKIYTTGNLKSYKEALTMQNQVKHEGIKNATIAAYQNGNRIALNDARKLTNETANP